MSESLLKLERMTGVGYLNIRGDAGNPEIADVLRDVCNAALPTTANTVNGKENRVYWLGPDEWLLVGNIDAVQKFAEKLEKKLQHLHVAVNDLSGGQVSYRLAGDAARHLLAKGCTLDLHPDVFGAGHCAQTGLAKAAVLISPLESGDGYDIIVRRSFADYLWQWLMRAGSEYRIEVA